MNRRNTILLGLLIVQLIVGVLIITLPAQPALSAGKPLFDVKSADITQVTVNESKDKQLVLAKKDTGWVLPQSDDFPVDGAKVSALLDKITAIQTGRLIASTAASHAQLKVAEDDYTRRIDFGAPGAAHTLFLGTPSGTSSHVRAGNSDEVYLSDKLSSFDANAEAANWINPVYFTMTKDNLSQITLSNISGTLTFRLNSLGSWMMDGLNAGEAFNVDKFNEVLTQIGTLNMTQPLGKADKPEYGLAQPAATLTLTPKGDPIAGKPITLKVGAKDSAENAYTISASSSPYIVRVAGFSVEPLTTLTRKDFIQAPPTPAPGLALTPTPTANK